MSTFLITQTQFADVRPIDPAIELSSDRLRLLLQKHLSAEDFAAIDGLFADPEPVVGAAATDWYTDFAEQGVALADLDADAQADVLARVGQICAQISAVAETLEADAASNRDADFLRAAISVPDNSSCIYAFGDKPVIVAWGHKSASAARPPVPAGLWVKSSRSVDEARLQAGQAQQTATSDEASRIASVGGVGVAPGFGWLAWLLWALFLVLLIVILWILLRGCSLGWPQSSLAQRLGLLNHCPVQVAALDNPVLQQTQREAALQQAIRDAELSLAENAQRCRVTRRQEDTARLETLRRAAPEQTTPDARTAEADDRVREAGGQSGEMQVVLQWDGPSDLDMSVTCGSGTVNYNRRTACEGGELDIDANHEVHMERPVENIHWAEMPPGGSYGVSVRNHSNRGDPRGTIPFSVLVRQGDQERTYQGEVRQGQTISVTDIIVE